MKDVTLGLKADLAKGPVSIRSQGFFAFAFRFVVLLGLTCVLGFAAASNSHSIGLRAIYMFSAAAGVFVLLLTSLAARSYAKGLPELTLTSEGFIYHPVSPTLVRWTDVISCFVTDVGSASSAKTLVVILKPGTIEHLEMSRLMRLMYLRQSRFMIGDVDAPIHELAEVFERQRKIVQQAANTKV
ncbi:hypothetical protein [Bradyrhizobium sp. 195]|uniref:hypothetical protein n=1 Tax=Bradyrhizobium sp. 195 TaxID=2782662 RepID=UPI002001D472|nr:hypothetical protein [Bradyrhizobium sp. 195]UPK29429.1 hypothetical protein IVB26_13855 [Bradyrhizobium sp. 195]